MTGKHVLPSPELDSRLALQGRLRNRDFLPCLYPTCHTKIDERAVQQELTCTENSAMGPKTLVIMLKGPVYL